MLELWFIKTVQVGKNTTGTGVFKRPVTFEVFLVFLLAVASHRGAFLASTALDDPAALDGIVGS